MATAELNYLELLEQPYSAPSALFGGDARGYVRAKLSFGLFLYDQFKLAAAASADESESLAGEALRAQTETLDRLFGAWLSTSQQLADQYRLRDPQGEFADLATVKPFLAACQDVALMRSQPERAHDSIASLEAGQGVSFEQAMNELRAGLR